MTLADCITLFKRLPIVAAAKSIAVGAGLAVAVLAATLMFQQLSLAQQNSADGSNTDDLYRHLSLFGDVFQRVRSEYVEEVEDKDLIEAAVNGMLTSLDPHSSFLAADDFDDIQERTRGEFGGLGIEITLEDGFVKVVSPIDDTPAANGGILSGDFIIAIDGQSLIGLPLTDSVEMMRGEVGTDITVTIRRSPSETFDVRLTRDVIKIRSVRHQSYGEVGYIRITTFSEQSTPGLIAAMGELLEDHGDDLVGIVLDLRNNPGGLLDEAISIADSFLDRGEIVSTRGRDTYEATRHFATSGDIAGGLPMVVLINSGSASASEIVAGALKDNERALVMGTRSFGKGSVQSVIPMRDNNAIRLTTARYYTPSGVSIQATGIEPDIQVELAVLEDLDEGAVREEDLRGVLDNGLDADGDANNNEESEAADADGEVAEEIRDYQLARAVDLLNGIDVFRRLEGFQ